MSEKTKGQPELRLQLLNLSQTKNKNILKNLFAQKKILHIVDSYEEQLKEYFEVTNPKLVFSPEINTAFKTFLKKITNKEPLWLQGRWVYFPWSSSLAHILSERTFFTVRTARNRNLITETEQKKFYDAVVGVAGLSVGHSAALAITLQGGARHIKLTDQDRLSLSNTNRVHSSVTNLGLLKVEMTARQIYELNPYAKIEIFPNGLNEENIDKFCDGLDVIIDEVDNLAIKYLLRVQAKKRKLPVIMATDNGDNGIIDIERFDSKKPPKFFHGRLGEVSYEQLKNLNKLSIGKLIAKNIGPANISEKTYKSFLEMGKTLVSWPQLGGAALINGSAIAYCVRKIVNNQTLENNRSILSLDDILMPNFNSKKAKNERKKLEKKIKNILHIC